MANSRRRPRPVPFAFSFDPWGRLVVVEAATPALSTYSIKAEQQPDRTSAPPMTEGAAAASCWISAAGGFYYVSNAGSANVSIYRLDSSGCPAWWAACRPRPRPARPTR